MLRILTAAFVGALIPWALAYAYIAAPDTIYYQAPPNEGSGPVIVAEPVKEETLEEMAARIAEEYSVPTSTLFNLVFYESRWDPNVDNGYDRGLVQINRKWNPEVSDAEAFDPEFSLRFAAEKIKNGKESSWVVCNCYLLVKTKIQALPKMENVIPNTPEPMAGMVAVFDYSGTKHIAYITGVDATGIEIFEANYASCAVGTRFVTFTDPALLGYWTPG